MTYWDAYIMPIPVRKYWISRYNKKNSDKKEDDVNEPLSEIARMKLIKNAEKASNSPSRVAPPPLMNSRRNTK